MSAPTPFRVLFPHTADALTGYALTVVMTGTAAQAEDVTQEMVRLESAARLAEMVASLNPLCLSIGDGKMRSMIAEANRVLNPGS